MNKLNLYFLLFAILFLSSCGSDIFKKDVLFYNSDLFVDDVPISLSIDGEEIEVDSTGFFTLVQLSTGEHSISSGGVFPETVNVTGDGIITSGKNDFYKYPVDYVADEASNSDFSTKLNVTGPIMIGDSTVVFKSTEFASLDALVARLEGLVKKTDGEYKRSSKAIAKTSMFIKLNEKNNFVEQNWDYNIDNIPEEITLYDGDKKTKSMVLPGDFISMYALFDESMSLETVTDEESLETIKAYIAMKHELLGY